jgi:MFS family permease
VSVEAEVRRARVSVFGYFGLCGLLVGVWAAGLPALDERLDLGAARLGTALLFISFGALISMPVAGRLCDRWSSRRVCLVAGPANALALLAPALAPSYGLLIVAALAFGLALGVLEIAMNVHAVEVERRYPRPIMSAFHGVWSLGGAAGGVLTAAGLRAGADAQALVVVAALLGVALNVPPARWLLAGASPAAKSEPAGASPRRSVRRPLVVLLGTVAFAGAVSEGAAMDWAVVHARDVLHATPAIAPLAFTTFSVAMTTVRLAGDGLRGRLGAIRIIRFAGLVAAGGYALVLIAPVSEPARMALAMAGWALVGVGLATIVPVVLSAVGATEHAAGRALSTVTMFGYAGLLAGPPVIGHLAEATSLPLALGVPAALTVYVAVAGPAVITALTPPRRESTVPESAVA